MARSGEKKKAEKTIKKSANDQNRKSALIDPYWLAMSHAQPFGSGTHWAGMLPVMIYSAFVILIVRAAVFSRPMDDFYWTNEESEGLTDFFSYDKMIIILVLAAVVLFIFFYRVLTATLYIKKTWIYVPMGVYSIFVLLSYAVSDYKEFSLLGYNGRFEGTLVLLAYMIMLFYIINAVNSERNVKMIMWSTGISMALLSILGFTQGTGHDFFQTETGKKMITSPDWWNELDTLNFTFTHNEIYQTVFNINYVSFYLALIIPVSAMLMISSINGFKESKKNKVLSILLILLFAALLYNLAGSKSTGGIVGLAAAFIAALILFNKKLIKWWKSVLIMMLVLVMTLAATSSMWMDEVKGTINRTTGAVSDTGNTEQDDTVNSNGFAESVQVDKAASVRPFIDCIITDGFTVKFSVNGSELDITAVIDSEQGEFKTLEITDDEGNAIGTSEINANDDTIVYTLNDERFYDYVSFYLNSDEEGHVYLILRTVDKDWPFIINADGLYYRNGYGKFVKLEKIKSIGFRGNEDFGSGRGYIWSRTLGMLKDNVIIGDGADTYCLSFPHKDYSGKYNAGWVETIDIIVDKPHNMYLNMFQGTGGISMLAFIAMMIMYMWQSIKVLHRNVYRNWLDYVSAGIFLGVIGFLVAGLFNDSTVSTMPLFYTMFGTGIAVNLMIAREKNTDNMND